MHTGLRVTGRLVCSGQIIAGEASRSLSSAPSEWGCQPSWSTSGGNRGSTTDHDWETAGEDSADWSRSDWSYFGAPRIRNARMCGRQYIYIYIHIDIYLGILVSHSQLSQLFLSDIYIHTHFHIINPDSYPGLHENPFSLVCPAGFTTVSKKRTDDRLRCKFNAVNDCVSFFTYVLYTCVISSGSVLIPWVLSRILTT